MPRLGQSMEEGTIVQWHKKEGDTVRQGEPLLEVMSDKANFDVESPMDGVVRKILAAVDGTLPVGHAIAILGTQDEPIEHLLGGAPASKANAESTSASPTATPRIEQPAASEGERAGPLRLAISPRARRIADERGIPMAALEGRGTGPGGRVLERDVMAYLEKPPARPGGVTRQ